MTRFSYHVPVRFLLPEFPITTIGQTQLLIQFNILAFQLCGCMTPSRNLTTSPIHEQIGMINNPL